MDPQNLDDAQLNHHIADLRNRKTLIQTELDDALQEWTTRHGSEPGTCISGAGITVRLAPNRRWDPQRAAEQLAHRPDLLEQVTTTVIDRARAQELLDEETYRACQKTLAAPRIIVELDG